MPKITTKQTAYQHRLTISLTQGQGKKLRKVAEKNQISAASLIRLAVKRYLDGKSNDPHAMKLNCDK